MYEYDCYYKMDEMYRHQLNLCQNYDLILVLIYYCDN